MEMTSIAPDANSLDFTDAIARDSAERNIGQGFNVIYVGTVFDALAKHCSSRFDAEVGGVLLGKVCRDAFGFYLLVDDHIPALAAKEGSAHLTFTADTWTDIHDQLDRDHAGATIVGWYHSHPGFGVFLSDMDLFIQRHFFDLPWQIALVIDPKTRDAGTFVWQNGDPIRRESLIERLKEKSFWMQLRELIESPEENEAALRTWLISFAAGLGFGLLALVGWMVWKSN